MAKTWSILANDGIWCAAAGDDKPDEAAASIDTRCGQSITLPHGVSRQAPTCPTCRNAIKATAVRFAKAGEDA
jgi:hypothetical protein